MRNFGKVELLLAFFITAAVGGLIAYKVVALDYTLTTIQPEDGYFVRLVMDVEGNGRNCYVNVTLPVQSERQQIRQEQQASDVFRYSISRGRVGRWYARDLEGEHTISYNFFAKTEARTYALGEGESWPATYPEKVQKYLAATEKIQVLAPEIHDKALELIPEGTDLKSGLQSVYNYVYLDIEYKTVRGPTDAVTALKLDEASCNGKNRLMVALLRSRNIPARLAKGLILESNRKRTTHAWTEVYVHDEWIPFCPTNGYFAEIPENYLELAKGDTAAFSHPKHIGFDWKWIMQRQLNHREQAVFNNANNPLNILSYWVSLKDYHISLALIMTILMIPIGATVVAFARNIVGLTPFGTFMPALIAVSFQGTGFIVGSLFFFLVVVISSGVNFGLIRLRVLHFPRLVIILTLVVISIMAVSIVSIRMGLTQGAAVSLFPMAILSLTAERFTQSISEDGVTEAMQRMAVTYLVAIACYGVITLATLQMLVAAFPELLLLNIAINLVIGSWTGIRLLEYRRFRAIEAPAQS